MDVTRFVKNFPIKNFTKGEVILSEGDVSDVLLAIQNGYVKVTSVDEAGNERMLWIAGRYDIVPTERLFSRHQPLQFFYTALSSGTVYQIRKDDFLAAAKTDLGLMTEIATSMSSHYDDLLSRINSAEQASVRDKLIATLSYLAKRFSADTTVDLYKLGLQLTHKDLAEMISSTRETTSVELQKLRAQGCIDYSRTQFIIYVDRCVI
ncbi:MAG TPA: Crp/Fnr family transcriptional regulator [Candidatus Saccharimonadales bacterium]|nr:Crp/Fnr family transcriptional regulator [Candidatus Saccharimonadales bacterium]